MFLHKYSMYLNFVLTFIFQANVIRHKSTEFMTFSMCLGNFVVALLWAIYGQLVQDNFILVSELSLLSTVLHHDSQSGKKIDNNAFKARYDAMFSQYGI